MRECFDRCFCAKYAAIRWILFLFLMVVPCASSQEAKSTSGLFHDDRLKMAKDDDSAIAGDDSLRVVSGMWVAESKDPAKRLLFLEQVKITCTHALRTCQELKVVLAPVGGMVLIQDPEETIWKISSWDTHGLMASYGPDAYGPLSDKCHRHVLTMSFTSGAVSTSDIPTHERGCEASSETDSYRLTRGQFYVDTTPHNDVNKPTK